ncbi:MAG TPA: glycosyltransferase [Gammaproteobacteria bacterium]|nr:glycosyltransferase [Gammaproteobacteria bacterium]
MTSASSNTAEQSPRLSIVIPAFNEEGNLKVVYAELHRVLEPVEASWELIFVDDGSSDATWCLIEELAHADSRVKGIRFSRNFGHQYALLAGLQASTGAAIISLDADLQHPPELIPRLIEEWQKGNKIVKTVRLDPEKQSLFKKLTSRLFYRVFSYVSGVKIESGMADYRLMDRQVLEDVLSFREEGLFLRGLVQWVGYPNTSISYMPAERFSGTTKYTLGKMVKFAWHGVSSFSIVPLRIGILFGFIASAVSFASVLYAILGKVIEGHTVPGWASSLAIISFLFGILFLFLGILGEYVGRILLEVRDRPRFIVSERLGISDVLPRNDMKNRSPGPRLP